MTNEEQIVAKKIKKCSTKMAFGYFIEYGELSKLCEDIIEALRRKGFVKIEESQYKQYADLCETLGATPEVTLYYLNQKAKELKTTNEKMG